MNGFRRDHKTVAGIDLRLDPVLKEPKPPGLDIGRLDMGVVMQLALGLCFKLE